jgi:hypothetical protein
MAKGTALIRTNDVAVMAWTHVWQAYFAAAASSSRFTLSHVFADGNRLAEPSACFALVRVRDARATLKSVTLSTEGHVAVFGSGRDATVMLEDVTVPRGLWGAVVAAGARMSVTDSHFRGLGEGGVMAAGQGTQLEVKGCEFQGVKNNAIEVVGAVTAHVENNTARECTCGLMASGPNARVDAIRNTFSRHTESGLFYKWGTMGLIQGNRCEHNKGHGIDTCGLGTNPRITENVCRFNGVYGIVW